MKTYPKVLVVSHNVFSETSNMGKTLANFFKGWPVENLAQFYLHSEVPTTKICTNYYRTTDFELLKFNSKKIGSRLDGTDVNCCLKSERVDTGTQAQIYQYGRSRKPYMYIGRNFLWGLNRWKTSRFKKWLDDFQADIIFLASGDYAFLYEIALFISKYKGIPIVTYICDDYYFTQKKISSPLGKIQKVQFQRVLKKLFKHNKDIVGICEKISKEYAKEFNLNPTTIMTSSSIQCKEIKMDASKGIRVSYIGNLGYNRHLSLIKIGKVLNQITKGNSKIQVYSTEAREEITSVLTSQNGIEFKGAIGAKEVLEVMYESDILIHTESFDMDNREKVKYSVSTKIADSLACGTCLFAYGPSEIASIQYLVEEHCACVVTQERDLEGKLMELLYNKAKRDFYIKTALEVAKANHNQDLNSEKIRSILLKAVDRSENSTNKLCV